VAGPVDDLGRVAGGDLAFGQDAQVGPGAAGGGEAGREPPAAHPDAQLEAGDARLGDLQQGPADPPALPHERVAHIDPAQGQVLPEGPRPQLAPDLGGVGVHRLVGPAVDLGVALLVAVDLAPPDPDPPRYRVLPDRGPHRPPPVGDLPGGPDVHRLDDARHADLPADRLPGQDRCPRQWNRRPGLSRDTSDLQPGPGGARGHNGGEAVELWAAAGHVLLLGVEAPHPEAAAQQAWRSTGVQGRPRACS
jgi:hypothetical protein